jgi:hypothetical protein
MAKNKFLAEKKAEQRRRKKALKAQLPKLDRIVHAFASPELLQVAGPLIIASWSVPDQYRAALLAAGRPIPPPVSGELLIDTGASSTCISQQAASELGLQALRLMPNYGAGGISQLPVFWVHLAISITDEKSGAMRTLEREYEAVGVPDLEKAMDPLNLGQGDRRVRLIGLLGRDIMRHATLVYDGPSARYELKFDLTGVPLTGKPGISSP